MKYLLVSLLVFLTACSVKNYEQTETKIVTIKTHKFKFSDIGYLRYSGNALELELFMAGHVFKKITINHLICVSDAGCITKANFNQNYLSEAYPSNILQNILLGHKIFQGKNYKQNAFGFTQNIANERVNIRYIVKPKVIYFKDRKNHILFRIKDIGE
jgi:hypothetical protein